MMNVTEEIQKVISQLDSLDDYYNELPNLQANKDLALSDLYHYIENNTMNSKSSYRIVKEMKKVLLERRKIKEDFEILKTFNVNRGKLSLTNNRKMLLSEVGKTQKHLSYEYNNRIYEKEELEEMLNG